MTAVYFVVGVNKQLDLQTPLTGLAREAAMRQGWFDYRRIVGAMLILGLIVAALACVWGAIKYWSYFEVATRKALAATLVLIGFIALRAATFRNMVLLPRELWNDLHVHRFVELASVVGVLFAVRDHMRVRRQSG